MTFDQYQQYVSEQTYMVLSHLLPQ